MPDAILRRIRPEQFRELVLLFVFVVMVIFFWTQIPNYFAPVQRIASHWSWRFPWWWLLVRCWSS
ncbi:MAG: hypothetical protein R2839_12465 [Thermomicrobiales bacterium]